MRQLARWYRGCAARSKVAVLLLATFLVCGAAGAMMTPSEQHLAVTGTSSLGSAPATQIKTAEKASPATRTEIETIEEAVPYSTTTTYDGTLPKDTTVVRVEGANGKKLVKTEVKKRDGQEVGRALISEDITVPPVTKVVAVGTKIVTKNKKSAADKCPTTVDTAGVSESLSSLNCNPAAKPDDGDDDD